MSMLAELKTRPSWVINPRASDWSKDQNKLGQKMLEKMGWTPGKGLGAKEQGPVEALRVAYKVDVRGLGATRKKEQEYWLQQQESFQSLLQNLNGGDAQNVEVKSLEERSKTSKARVHYHKFTRGKDISRYSKKDLSCIVGSVVAAPKVIPASVISNSQQQSEDKLDSSIGVDVLGNGESGAAAYSTPDPEQHSKTEMKLRSVRKLSSGDYVHVAENAVPAKKKKSKKKFSDSNVAVSEAKLSKSTIDEDSPQTRTRKSNRKLASDHEISPGDVSGDQKRSKRKSSRRTNNDVENVSVELRTPVNVNEDSSQTKPKRSKRKLADRTINDEDESVSIEHSTPVEVNEDSSQTKPKRSKRKLADRTTKDDDKSLSIEHSTPVEVDEDSSQTKPKRSKRKLADRMTNDEDESVSIELTTPVNVNEDSSQTKPKRSKRKLADGEDESVTVEHTTQAEVGERVQDSSKRARRKKKIKTDVSEEAGDCSVVPVKRRKKNNKVETPLTDGVVEEESKKKPAKRGRKKKEQPTNVETEDSAVEKQPKRKYKRKIASGGGDGEAENEKILTSLEDETKTGKGKKKKKKKKSTKSENGVDPEDDLVVSESQETVGSSLVHHENDDAETELGSINSQSSLINELLGVKMRNSIDHIVRPECWYKNHILSQDSEDEVSSGEERMTGIPKKKKG